LATRLFVLLLRRLSPDGPILLALDDTPTRRYGSRIK
jgi:hypothetical protein